jgi:hypothetical protein
MCLQLNEQNPVRTDKVLTGFLGQSGNASQTIDFFFKYSNEAPHTIHLVYQNHCIQIMICNNRFFFYLPSEYIYSAINDKGTYKYAHLNGST